MDGKIVDSYKLNLVCENKSTEGKKERYSHKNNVDEVPQDFRFLSDTWPKPFHEISISH